MTMTRTSPRYPGGQVQLTNFNFAVRRSTLYRLDDVIDDIVTFAW